MRDVKTKLLPLEFSVFNKPSFALGPKHKIVIGVSGGADSVALLQILARLKKRWRFELAVAYVHHGKSNSEKTSKYRDRAARKVEAMAKRLNLSFETLRIKKQVHESEENLRNERFAALEKFAEKENCDIIALGHHFDDLFETRLIRLLRGTGPLGLSAMTPLSKTESGKVLWRPLLQVRRQQIEAYLAELDFKKNRDWLEDPSNADARYLRNAVRRKLIPMIEKLRPGGATSMARSLELLSDFVSADRARGENQLDFTSNGELDRKALLRLEIAEQRESLSNWVNSLGVRNFSKAHVDELLKRIDTPQRRLTFELCGRVWLVERTIRLQTAQN